VEEALAALRADLQSKRADVIARNVTLTEDQAARFWPIYQNYQKEQSAIMDEQLRGIQQYVDHYQSLDDATALGLINAHLDRDVKMAALRQAWFAEFLKVLPPRVAGRVMQIDRRLSLAHQVQFTAKIPLVQ
jgi:Spy/CpxP family protein refolding chaperone